MAFELSTVVYTNDEYGLRVVKDQIYTRFKDIDHETFTVPNALMDYLISFDQNSSDEVYQLTYIINKAFANVNYAEIEIDRQIDDRYDNDDKDEEVLTANNYVNIMAVILDRYKENIDLLVLFFESIKDYQIVDLFQKNPRDVIIAKLDRIVESAGVPFNGAYKDSNTYDDEGSAYEYTMDTNRV